MDLFFSEYIEGSSFNKALEIYNGTGIAIDLASEGYTLELYSNGSSTPSQSLNLTGAIAPDDVFVLANPSASTAILDEADVQNGAVINFNGDDSLVLRKNGTIIDVFGQIGVDPGASWPGGGANVTLRRKLSVVEGDTNGQDAFDASVEWDSFANDTFDGLGRHTVDSVDPVVNVLINEVDADTPGQDAAEFVELYDGGVGNTALDGLTLVFFNGSDDASYTAFDLDGFTTNADGFFVLGNPGVANVDLVFDPGGFGALQNGADAVALYQADATAFPNDTPVTTTNLLDAIVYDTNDDDDSGLLTGLGITQQFNEGANGNQATESNSRVPDGSGDFVAQTPTPGAVNDQPVVVVPTPIYEIQGSGAASPIVGQTVVTTGVVTGDFQDGDADDSRNLRGFYVQDATGDDDVTTSDGIFVFESSLLTDVNVGDVVEITGTVTEFFGETQVTASAVEVVGSGSITPVAVDMPAVDVITNADDELIADLEQYEGMLVTFNDTLTVDEYFNYDRFGEIRLSEGDRPFQFTQTNTPDQAGYQAHLEDLARRTITLDDGQTVQNPDPLAFPAPGFSDSNAFRGGDTVTGLTGTVRFSRGSGGSGDETYRIMPTVDPTFVSQNPRPAGPEDVGGRLKVASFNVLNYFTTLDEGSNGSGPNNLNPRGADNQAEFDRQTQKLVTTIVELDADILGLVEVENNFLPGASGNAVENLVNELNAVAGAGTYDWVNPGQQFVDVGDAISVGSIYKTASVEITAGTSPAILTDSNLPTGFAGETIFNGVSTNRAPLAVSFTEKATGEVLTIAVNHFKSKGSIFNPNNEENPVNADSGDGQGNNNPLRLRAAEAVNAWLQDDPTNSGDGDFLILGDLNAYANEDPITYLEGAGYTDLGELFAAGVPYSFLFDGQLGTLDYALANNSLLSQVTGATEWHVNADEADALDYNLDFGRNPDLFNGTNSFRNSDHDPLIVGLALGNPGEDIIGTSRRDTLTGTSGDDTIQGLANRDRLTGGDGEDTLVGGRDNDVLTGGADSDTFVYERLADRRDRITDFEVGSDVMDFSDIFELERYGSATPFDDYIQVIQRGSDTIVQVDVNGDSGRRDRFRTMATLDDVSAATVTESSFLL